jgi:putative ABC transport system permease protein
VALGPSERIIAGEWWDEGVSENPEVQRAVEEGAVRVSLEVDVAEELGVEVGDRIVWDIQGVSLPSVVTSLREVEWTSFQPNFFAVFEPGALDGAPGTYIALVEAEDEGGRERIQRALIDGFPNVSFLDLTTIRETLDRVTGESSFLLRAMAGFILVAGGGVFLAALLSTRFRRRRESALLKTLGARASTIRAILLTAYALLGIIGGGVGLLLGGVGGELLLRGLFDPPGGGGWGDLLGVWIGVVLLAILSGWSVSGPVLRAPAMAILREG